MSNRSFQECRVWFRSDVIRKWRHRGEKWPLSRFWTIVWADFLLQRQTSKTLSPVAGTDVLYKVYRGCKHFLFRFWLQQLQSIFPQTWNGFCVPGQEYFYFPSNSICFFFFSHFNTTNSCISFIWHLKRQEVIDHKVRALCQTSLVKERRLTLAIVCLAFKAAVWLLLGVRHVVCVRTLLIRMNPNTWWNLF